MGTDLSMKAAPEIPRFFLTLGIAYYFIRPSVIAARKSLRVNGGFSEPPSKKKRGRRNAERRTLVTAAA
jgi:hypothetical protein